VGGGINGVSVKAALYNAAGTSLLAQSAATVVSTTGEFDIPFIASVSVAAGSYIIYFVSSVSAVLDWYFGSSSGVAFYLTTAGQYALGPPATLPAGTPAGLNPCIGLFVQ
jgi:hypothetical protein